MKKKIERPGQFHREEMTLTLYTGDDHRPELRELREKVVSLPDSAFVGARETREEMLAELDAMIALVDQKFGDYDGQVASDELNEQRAALRAIAGEFGEAKDVCAPLFEGRPVKEIRQWARTVYRCNDCGLVIAMVIPLARREVLLVRERDGAMRVQMWLETKFWGVDAYCKRRHFALHRADVKAEARRTVGVSHADKTER